MTKMRTTPHLMPSRHSSAAATEADEQPGNKTRKTSRMRNFHTSRTSRARSGGRQQVWGRFSRRGGHRRGQAAETSPVLWRRGGEAITGDLMRRIQAGPVESPLVFLFRLGQEGRGWEEYFCSICSLPVAPNILTFLLGRGDTFMIRARLFDTFSDRVAV
jgi:hypothetical protein